jgi:hypothetical protein
MTYVPPNRIPFSKMPREMTCFTQVPLDYPKSISFGCRRKAGHPDAPEPVGEAKDWDNLASFAIIGTNPDITEHDQPGVRLVIHLMCDWANAQDWLLEHEDMKAGFDWLLGQLKSGEKTRVVDVLAKDRVMCDRVMFLLFHFIGNVKQPFWTWLDGQEMDEHTRRHFKRFETAVKNAQGTFKTHKSHHIGFEISTTFIGIYLWGNKGEEEVATPAQRSRANTSDDPMAPL